MKDTPLDASHCWVEIGLLVTEEAEEAASALLFSVGCSGTSSIVDPKGVVVKGYLPAADHTGDQLDALWSGLLRIQDAGLNCGQAQVLVSSVDEEDWAESWKKYFHPLEVGETWLIKPTWERVPYACERRILELDPGMAFGSGTHPTTQLCLLMLERVLLEGLGLDVGCGSGILAIAMAKQGLGHVLAVDNDPLAVRVAQENCRLNQVEQQVDVQLRDLGALKKEKADVVMANLTSQTILDYCLTLSRCVKPGGVLLASGINLDRGDRVQAALRKTGLVIQEVFPQDEWLGILAVNKSFSC